MIGVGKKCFLEDYGKQPKVRFCFVFCTGELSTRESSFSGFKRTPQTRIDGFFSNVIKEWNWSHIFSAIISFLPRTFRGVHIKLSTVAVFSVHSVRLLIILGVPTDTFDSQSTSLFVSFTVNLVWSCTDSWSECTISRRHKCDCSSQLHQMLICM